MVKKEGTQSKAANARERMRRHVPPGYSHLRHFLTLALLTLTPVPAFIWMLVMSGMTWLSLVGVPVGIIVGNFIEYMTHRFPMHRKMRGAGKALYKRHAGTHHAIFTDDDMVIDDPRDLYHVMMTPKPAVVFMLVIGALVVSMWFYTGIPALAAVFGITLCGYFFAEEALHMSFHLRSTWEGGRPWNRLLRRIGEHHRAHHNPRVMREQNFAIALPIFDWVFGTGRPDRK